MRVCVYSAIYGDYDVLRTQSRQTVPTDFICFTEPRDMAPVEPWTIIRSDILPNYRPRMRAKYFKIMNHVLFPNGRLRFGHAFPFAIRHLATRYDYTIWIDGSVDIKRPDFVKMMIDSIGDSGWAMFTHPDRTCIYDELVVALAMPKYDGPELHAQVESYRREGFPKQRGLMACTVIARASGDPRLAAINDDWWRENLHWSDKDQMSLPVVLWRFGHGYDAIDLNLWDNEYFDWRPHRAAPGHDIVALAATIDNDGIVKLSSMGVFAVATVNLGSGGMITVTADTGDATIPVTISICETDPASGACLAAPVDAATGVTTQIDSGETPTFGIFVDSDEVIPFDPAVNRIFVRFTDDGGTVRGATSVAVQTQ